MPPRAARDGADDLVAQGERSGDGAGWLWRRTHRTLPRRRRAPQPFRDRQLLFEEHEDSYRELLLALDLVSSQLELVQNAVEDTLPLVRRGKLFQEALRFWTEGGDSTFVYWTDRRGRSLHLQATPVDVAATLRSRLMDRDNPVILTSATLTVAGNFEYSQTRLGLENSRTLHVESLFNYAKAGAALCPAASARSPATRVYGGGRGRD